MSDLMNAIIAAKLMGNGGGGGGSGLPPITTETTEIFAPQGIPFSSQDGMYIATLTREFSINDGDKLDVEWDETAYNCTVSSLEGALIWGNLSIVGAGGDTGEPFLMAYISGDGLTIYTALTAASHNVGISSTSYNPPTGSVLITEGDEWVERRLQDLLPVYINIGSTTPVTVAARDIEVFNGAVVVAGAPASWKTCGCYGANLVTNSSSNPTGLQIGVATVDLTAGTAQIIFVNNTGSSITATGGFTWGGLFMKLS